MYWVVVGGANIYKRAMRYISVASAWQNSVKPSTSVQCVDAVVESIQHRNGARCVARIDAILNGL